MVHAGRAENSWKKSNPKDVRIFSCSMKIKLEFNSSERRARTKVVEWMMIKVFWLAGEGKSFAVDVVWECMVAQYVQHSWFPSAPSLFSSVRNLGRAHSKERNNASSSCKWSVCRCGCANTWCVAKHLGYQIERPLQRSTGPRMTGFWIETLTLFLVCCWMAIEGESW